MGVIGSGFCIAGLCLGFTFGEFGRAVEAGKFQLIGPVDLQDEVGSAVSDAVTESIDYEQKFEEIESLDIDLGVGDCTIYLYDGDEWKISGSNLPGSFKCRKSGDTLEIDCQKSRWMFWSNTDDCMLELYVPESCTLEKIDIDCGVGNVETHGGVLRCEELDLDCGVGECDMRMEICDKADIDGGVGDLMLTLSGEQDDFDYDVDCGIGEIRIGDLVINELGGEWQIDNDADREIVVDCGVGTVKIEFEEE